MMILAALAVTSYGTDARADYLKLYAPKVDKGEFSAEADLNYSQDHRSGQDGYFSQVYGAEYGVTNYWMTELGVEAEKANNDSNTKLTNIKWENIIVPFKPGENWIDTGLYIETEKGATSKDPNNFEAKVLLEKDFGKIANTINAGVSHQFGPNHSKDWNESLAIRTSYKLDREFKPGLEYYADFGNITKTSYNEQSHKFGPVFQGKIGKVKYDTGVLFGVSHPAQDTTVKLNLEYEF